MESTVDLWAWLSDSPQMWVWGISLAVFGLAIVWHLSRRSGSDVPTRWRHLLFDVCLVLTWTGVVILSPALFYPQTGSSAGLPAVWSTLRDLGVAFIGAAFIGGVIIWVEQSIEDDRVTQAERRDLRAMLSSGTEFPGIDLRGADLSGMYLKGRNFAGANLIGSVLDGANLTDANLTGALLSRASLVGALLWRADLEGSILRRADMRNADLCGARLTRVMWLESDLNGAVWNAYEIARDLPPTQLPERMDPGACGMVEFHGYDQEWPEDE